MAKGILVFIEQRNGALRKASLEALSEARRWADKWQETVAASLLGADLGDIAGQLFRYRPDKVLVADHPALASYSTEGYADALAEAIRREDPRYIFAAHSLMAKDFLPRVAARFDAPMVSDVVELSSDNGQLLAVHPMYAGKAYGTFEFSGSPAFLSLRPNAFSLLDNLNGNHAGALDKLTLTPGKIRARVSQTHAAAGQKLELTEAGIIVSGGRGIKGPENWGMLQDLCDVLGAALGASRAVVDAGWIDHQHQVGQTGKTVSPQLYIACGISGAIQHLAGMSSAKVVVAINKNPDAPIFKNATYGIVGDVFEVVPRLTEELRKLKAEG